MNRIFVEFLTRSGCHLCESVRPSVHRAARWAGMSVREVDIETDDDLVRDFGVRIPVVRVGGAVVGEGTIGAGGLWRRLVAIRAGRKLNPSG